MKVLSVPGTVAFPPVASRKGAWTGSVGQFVVCDRRRTPVRIVSVRATSEGSRPRRVRFWRHTVRPDTAKGDVPLLAEPGAPPSLNGSPVGGHWSRIERGTRIRESCRTSPDVKTTELVAEITSPRRGSRVDRIVVRYAVGRKRYSRTMRSTILFCGPGARPIEKGFC